MGKGRANIKYCTQVIPWTLLQEQGLPVQVDLFFQTAGNCALR